MKKICSMLSKVKGIKFILIFLCMTVGGMLSGTIVSAAEAYGDYTYEYADRETSIRIVKYNGSDSNVEIPQELNGLTVKYIAPGAFANNKKLVSVVIPETVVEIGNSWSTGVFSNCSRLQKVTFRAGSEDAFIGDSTFYNCPSLTSITIPSNYVTIYENAFKNCTKLKEVKWETSISNNQNQVLGNAAFSGCKGLKSISLPGNLKSIGSYAFEDCTLLTTVKIPEGTEIIGVGAFQRNTSLTSVSIPSTIKEIGNSWSTGAFENCSKLSKVTIANGENDAFIGNATFNNCSSLSSITIPGNYINIYDRAFMNCTKLKTVTYNKSSYDYASQVIGNKVFSDCKSLESVSLATSLKTIESYAFQNCTLLKQIAIPEGVTVIGIGAFENNSSLKKVSLPSTIVEIGNSWSTGAFSNCSSLTSVIMKEGQEDAFIGNSTFQNCTSLKSITIPGNYITIYDSAFRGCTKLESVSYKKSSYEYASQEIRNNVFNDCKSLKTVSLPTTLKSIGSYAFYNCTGLKKIEIKEGVEKIDIGAFQNATSLVTITLPSTLTSLGNGWSTGVFENCTKLRTVTMPTGDYELYIGDNTFRNCSSLSNIYIGKNVKDDSSTDAFQYCNPKARVYSSSKTAIGLAKAAGIKASYPASNYVNGKSLFGTAIISGTPKAGYKLTANTLAIAPVPASLTYKWTIDGKVVSTKNTYTLKKSDKNKKITLTISGNKGFKGSLSSAVKVK